MNELAITLETIVLSAWFISMIKWVRSGAPMPNDLHGLAVAAMGLGIGSGAWLNLWMDPISPAWLIGSLIFPAAFIYVGWVWMFGPETVSRFERPSHQPPLKLQTAEDVNSPATLRPSRP